VRVLPADLRAAVVRDSWTVPPEFAAVQEHGRVSDDEMFLTFNMGVGMIVVVSEDAVEDALETLRHAGEDAWVMGSVQSGTREVTIR
jgi:phosphoribosylformylglycinamidine cyclo-ligase